MGRKGNLSEKNVASENLKEVKCGQHPKAYSQRGIFSCNLRAIFESFGAAPFCLRVLVQQTVLR